MPRVLKDYRKWKNTGGRMSMNVSIQFDKNDLKYVLQALREYKDIKLRELKELEEDNDLINMYGNDVMLESETYQKVLSLAMKSFKSSDLVISYETV